MDARPKMLWSRVHRLLTERPERFAGGAAVAEPLELLAVEQERLALLRRPADDGGATATSDPGDDAA
jgi:hypothetical protein